MIKDSKILGSSEIPSDKELQEIWDEHLMKKSKTIEFSDRVVEYIKNQLEETLLELENLDVEITSKCPSAFYCAKRNIIEILEILEHEK